MDTANVYNDGESERIIGKAVRENREKWVIATKVHRLNGRRCECPRVRNRFHIMSAVEASLKRLDTDHIDVYYLHRWDASTPNSGITTGFRRLRETGEGALHRLFQL